MSRSIYTVGHSNGTIERLIELLQKYSIKAVADVRSRPYSRFNPQFNQEALAGCLRNEKLEYVFLGSELGARSEDPSCYRGGRVQYSLIARTKLFQQGMTRLLGGMERFTIAILCAEKEPLVCHRGILISPQLYEKGIRVQHILEDGTLEDHETSVARLLEIHGLQDDHLFHSRDERIALAYEKQAEQIQYSQSQESLPA